MTTITSADVPVRKTITVNASLEHAFSVFTDGYDTWWPRSHHIGSSPMKRAILEGRTGGRCYSEQEDGTDCDWGTVVVWDPPTRIVIAWQISSEWKYEPDLARSSEVEVVFTPEPGGRTRVDLEHRYLARHGAGADRMREAVGGEGGWGGLLQLFARKAEQAQG